jgi:hypothetical protein
VCLAAAYRDVAAIDAGELSKAASLEDAYAFVDQVTVAIREHPRSSEDGIRPSQRGLSHTDHTALIVPRGLSCAYTLGSAMGRGVG